MEAMNLSLWPAFAAPQTTRFQPPVTGEATGLEAGTRGPSWITNPVVKHERGSGEVREPLVRENKRVSPTTHAILGGLATPRGGGVGCPLQHC